MIENHRNVAKLDVSSTAISLGTLREISNMTSLESLNVKRCEIDDEGMSVISQLKNLTFLNVSFCISVTDQGVASLSHLKELKNLLLTGSLKNLADILKAVGK